MNPSTQAVQAEHWHPSLSRRILAKLTYPIFYALNRPSMSWFANMLYDFALRCSGIAITFGGQHGLTRPEENFLTRNAAALRNGVLLDVGANHGAYAKYLARLAPESRIVAFEPHPRTFEILSANTAGIGSIELINKAVGEAAGNLQLHDFEDEDGSTQASLSRDAVALYSSKIVTHDVECTTIDAFMAEAGIERIDLLKIDTEGHDLAVLRGARNSLREGRIRMIQFEFIPADIATGATMRGFFEELAGYRINRICMNGDLWPLTRYDVKRCEIYVTQNLIAVPIN